MSFVPPGYVSAEHVLEAVGNHLFPEMFDQAIEGKPSSAELAAIKSCFDFLRSLLFERKLIAFYHDDLLGAMFDHPIQEVQSGFWLSDRAALCLLSGRYENEGEASSLWFQAGAIEAILKPEPKEATPPAPSGGRPRKLGAALSAYDALYPNGHRVTGEGWKDVAQKISEHLGESISIDTIQRALSAG